MIKIGIVGVSGYTGETILEILLKHKDVRVTYVSSNDVSGKVSSFLPRFRNMTVLESGDYDVKKAIELCDLIFLAVPHTVAMKIAPKLLNAKRIVIDLSADYRLKSKALYKKWYGQDHADKKYFSKGVYGLPELYRENIKKAKFIANPGCYPTAAILGLAPLVSVYGKSITSIVIDAKSGVSGAGKKAALPFMFSELNENFKAYRILKHQHSPEIDLYLSKLDKNICKADFVPHLLPMTRGILETIYVRLNGKVNLGALHKIYKRFYKTEHFVRVLAQGQQPELKNVIKTNYCDIGLEVSSDGKLVVVTSAIDNLVKGAAGQAVQNMNIIKGFDEKEGLV